MGRATAFVPSDRLQELGSLPRVETSFQSRWSVVGDPDALEAALLTFSKKLSGTPVVVSTRDVIVWPEPNFGVPGGAYVVVDVSESSPGLQLERPGTCEVSSALAKLRSIASRARGHVTVAGEVGSRSIVSVYLPMAL